MENILGSISFSALVWWVPHVPGDPRFGRVKITFPTRKRCCKYPWVQDPAAGLGHPRGVGPSSSPRKSQEGFSIIFHFSSIQTLRFHPVSFPFNVLCEIVFCFNFVSVQIPLASFYWGVFGGGFVVFFSLRFCSLNWNQFSSAFRGNQKLIVEANTKLMPGTGQGLCLRGKFCNLLGEASWFN